MQRQKENAPIEETKSSMSDTQDMNRSKVRTPNSQTTNSKPATADSNKFMDRVLSRNVITMGEDFGITADFICHQTAD